MADTKLTGLTATTTPVLTDYGYIVTTPGGTPASHYATLDVLQQLLLPKTVTDGRLTLTTGTPVTTADVTNATTVYYTPYRGNKIGLYDGTNWHVRTFSEISIAVGAFTASRPYDIWVYDNSGTPALDSTVWTSATARATALAYQDGVLVKSGAATRRYVGTIYIDSGQKTQDALLTRYVWNYYNRIHRRLYVTDATQHNYSTASWQSWNSNTNLRIQYVCGVVEDAMIVTNNSYSWSSAAGIGAYTAVGYDSVSAAAAPLFFVGVVSPGVRAGQSCTVLPLLGYHYIQALEFGTAATATFQDIAIEGNLLG